MQTVPLQPIPAQIVRLVLGAQNVQMNIRQKPQGLFVDIVSNGTAIMSAVIARDADPLVSRTYSGFAGNLVFVDTQGSDDPIYTGFGSRFSLVYLTADEYALIQ